MKNHTFIEYVQGGKLLHRICLDLNTLSHVLMLNLWNEAPLKSRARCQYFPKTNYAATIFWGKFVHGLLPSDGQHGARALVSLCVAQAVLLQRMGITLAENN